MFYKWRNVKQQYTIFKMLKIWDVLQFASGIMLNEPLPNG